jgi:ATP-dependent helicase/nuclease subunit B
VLTGFVMRLPARHGGPTTPEQGWQLAGELGRLFDEVALEEKDPALLHESDPLRFAEAWLGRLEALVPQEQATHWQITTTFLRGIASQWAGWLTEHGLLDIGLRRVLALRAQTEAWERDRPDEPIIAAGIGVGGTIPAAAELLRVVAGLPRGAVVLHGLDRRALGRIWSAVEGAPTHPFSSQARLLKAMEADDTRIRRWPGCEHVRERRVPEARAALIEMALRPPEGLDDWTRPEPALWRPGLDGLALLAAPDAQAEAAAIALTLREALEVPGARAALVTPDRDLARRVSAELTRHGILADDSAGEPLGTTPSGAFLRLLARMVAEDFAPVPLLATLKHPLAAAGMDRAEWLGAVRLLERRVLRGPRPQGGLAGLRRAAQQAFAQDADALARLVALLDALERRSAISCGPAARRGRPPTCSRCTSARRRRWRRPRASRAGCACMRPRRARCWPRTWPTWRRRWRRCRRSTRAPGPPCSTRRWKARPHAPAAPRAGATWLPIRASRSSACWRRGCCPSTASCSARWTRRSGRSRPIPAPG